MDIRDILTETGDLKEGTRFIFQGEEQKELKKNCLRGTYSMRNYKRHQN